jgi:hypothetical protein
VRRTRGQRSRRHEVQATLPRGERPPSRPTPANAARVWTALEAFGAPLRDLTHQDLQDSNVVSQIGVVPNRIDVLTSITGVEFEPAWQNRVLVSVSGLEVPTIAKADLIRNKRALGRPRDLADVAELEEDASR